MYRSIRLRRRARRLPFLNIQARHASATAKSPEMTAAPMGRSVVAGSASRYPTAIAISATAGRTAAPMVPLTLPPRGSQYPSASAIPMNNEASSM